MFCWGGQLVRRRRHHIRDARVVRYSRMYIRRRRLRIGSGFTQGDSEEENGLPFRHRSSSWARFLVSSILLSVCSRFSVSYMRMRTYVYVATRGVSAASSFRPPPPLVFIGETRFVSNGGSRELYSPCRRLTAINFQRLVVNNGVEIYDRY